jgi:putative polymerase
MKKVVLGYSMNLRNSSNLLTGTNSRPSNSPILLLLIAVLMNAILAFVNNNIMQISGTSVKIVQAFILFCCVAFSVISIRDIRARFLILLYIVIMSLIVTNFVNDIDIKTFNDTLIIPIFMLLGFRISKIREGHISLLLAIVVASVILEVYAESVYLKIFNPASYYYSTREWVAELGNNAAAKDGYYYGSYRAGESVFALASHRVGGLFLEPLSLGYFSVIIANYYIFVSDKALTRKIGFVVVCLFLCLSSDSRVSAALICISLLLYVSRIRLPHHSILIIFPAVFSAALITYLFAVKMPFDDTLGRLDVTFGALANGDLVAMIFGNVPLERFGDSGMIYLIRCVGLLGFPAAIVIYTGYPLLNSRVNVNFMIAMVLYFSVTLLFGGAVFSIKTASLYGGLIGAFCREKKPSD